ncbi:transcription termination factor NusA [Calditerricola satsumensis]|uniref:Transcription termination/antitermination protein NusA n=1 Tax=Calditerricola satsumensis TaxID=373054 RepID=A0A8J3FCA5_9BACI|nr:transcription termination factor NusA [Calditerricola satsumensis]GGJ99446.1 transcription termination/antitermination protein NusA [Calditerricola satsumensis]
MNADLIQALNDLEREKGISKETLIEAIEAALISGYKRNFNSAQNVRVDINRETGEVKVYARKTVVEEVTDPRLEISLDTAKQINPNYQLGDIVEIEVTPRDFGRIAAQTAKQVVTQRIREAERQIIYHTFVDREHDIITGIAQRRDSRFWYIDLGRTEGLLPLHELMPTDNVKQGDRIKAYITRVEKTTKGPQILLSRTHPGLLKRLFELEVPEIYDGVVEIKAVAREPGERSKIAVTSHDPNVDPVGACVGPKGMRVQTVVNELNGEKVDIVRWSDDPAEFIANALSPAKVIHVLIDRDSKVSRVIVPDHQLSLAIGRRGQNARLAAKLTGWKIDIKSETQAREEGLWDPDAPTDAADEEDAPDADDAWEADADAADGSADADLAENDAEAVAEEGAEAATEEGAEPSAADDAADDSVTKPADHR